jgi:glycine cleavage system H protein
MVAKDRKYAESHEWVKIDGDLAVVGISDHAQESLGDITFVELPSVGAAVQKGKECGVIESVKAASDLYSPVSGEVAEVNGELESAPEKINGSPHEEGWLFKVRNVDAAELESLMDAAAYADFLEKNE